MREDLQKFESGPSFIGISRLIDDIQTTPTSQDLFARLPTFVCERQAFALVSRAASPEHWLSLDALLDQSGQREC